MQSETDSKGCGGAPHRPPAGSPPEFVLSSPPPGRSRSGHAASLGENWYFRHPLAVRVAHWINLVTVSILLISGLQIYDGNHQWLAIGRWGHFFFAWIFAVNGLFFSTYSLLSRHLFRDLLPRWKELRKIGPTLRGYFILRRFRQAERRYNVLQKIVYTGVLFGLAPSILLSGLVLSPRVDASFPLLLALFRRRQSARRFHLIAAILVVAYTLIHILMVSLTGFRNRVGSMITGWYRIEISEKARKKGGK